MTVGVIATAEGATQDAAWFRIAAQAFRMLGHERGAQALEASADRCEAEASS